MLLVLIHSLPTRPPSDLQKTGEFDGAHSNVFPVPSRYVNRGFGRAEFFVFYRAAKIGLVTPLRDVMNLVAKEYVAAQDPEDPGVLILSRFAGSGKQMQAALIVNHYDTEGVAARLQTARHMSVEE